ncbi:conserved hypothetical protein [Histoplasma mississippiense (nom. inval.)]|uniref:conserved hypothetical protein n=1 Tax=Ajellomyces capsulatus (strain NAm1 / WU24) TaxID=2059318 RepID=UPI000157C2E2|nr:conserved hypothetical protein [Histoplasma mississippiense (nom. inval.)]EDN07657.1 conserved hypothetical protein [Histoplasma mississippiense (nom. inval.)]
MFNALGGLGGSGQVDPTVAANANVALLAANAATALFVVGPIFSIIGPRACWLVGGWTYALYSGSLLAFNTLPPANHFSKVIANGPFVIVAGGILGVGASFLWVAQGAIMTTYVPEAQKGRAIAVFWIVFNMGGTIGSLASFGLNFHNSQGTVSNSTYIATMAVMGFGWLIGIFICPPSRVQLSQLREAEYMVRDRSLRALGKLIFSTIFRLQVVCSLPLFFCANLFYSYQQNDVNGRHLHPDPFSKFCTGYCYWLIGSMSNSAAVTAILVGAYKSFQATGGAMAWRVNALKTPSMSQLAMNWGLCIGALIIAIPAVLSVTLTNVVQPEPVEQRHKGNVRVEEWEIDTKRTSS